MTPSFTVRSPATGAVVAELSIHGEEDVRSAVGRARTAQSTWAALDARQRARTLRRLARVLFERSDEIVERIRAETGKPELEALSEIVVSVDLIRYYARIAPRHLRARRVGSGWMLGKRSWVETEPYGVIGAITPWNYPFILAMDSIVPALFAGNGAVIKPSELTPTTTLLIPEMCVAAGLPEGLVGVVTGRGETGRALVGSGVDRLVFTGSTATGRKIMAAAAETLTPVTLELGGKDPAIVLDDADIERAARGVVFGAFFNAGQTCISVERVYVVQSVYDVFLDRVCALASQLRVGALGETDLGPIVTEPQMEIIKRQVEDARARGARVLTGGTSEDEGESGVGVFLPTVLADVDESMAVLREESFGPLLPVVSVADEEEAIARANALGYGLCASVWTRSRRRGERIARRLRAGGVSINDVLSHYGVPGLPMGGQGESGFGRRRGVEALDEMCRTRALFEDRLGLRRELWWFPYSRGGNRMVRALLAWRGRGGLGGVWDGLRQLWGRDR